MTAPASNTYELKPVYSYGSPKDAIEGIEKETVEVAKKFSPDTRQWVERNTRAQAETARKIITDLATELSIKIQKFPDAREQETSRVMRETWTTAENLRKYCLDDLEHGAYADYADTLKKVDKVKSKIEGSTFDQLAASGYVAPAIASAQPKEPKKAWQNVPNYPDLGL